MTRAKTAYVGAAFVVLAFCGDACAEFSVGGAFRHPGYGARVWGMGGAGAATVDDESAVYWNPAMLAVIPNDFVGASYLNLVQGTTARQSQLAYARVLKMNESDYDRSSARHVIGALYTNVYLGITEGNDYSENLLRIAYAFSPDHFITFAAAIEGFFSRSSVDNFDAFGTSVDGAIRVNVTRHATLAVIARDAFSRYSYDDGRDFKKDRGFTAALGYDGVRWARIEGDVWWDYGAVSRFIIGAESNYLMGHLALRAGVASLRSGESRTVPYFGFGVRLYQNHLNIHYNANLDDEAAFEDTHRFTLSVML